MAGDGFKNYYTFAYQYKYGTGLHFDGFMYPYGDLATYADAQIIIVWILQGLRSIGLDAEPYLLGILNYLPLFSFVIAGLILVRIFIHYKVSYPYALLFTVACIGLSPQIFRVQSHFALAYAYVIPFLWWINLNDDKKLSGKIGITILSCFFLVAHGFIHPYLIFICSLFLLALWMTRLLFKRRFDWAVLIQGLLPVISFLVLMNSLDSVSDRPKNPYGLMIHKTEVSDLFPFYGWFNTLFGDLLNLRNGFSEGLTYPGILLIAIPIALLIKKGLASQKKVELILSRDLWTYFSAGILCLAFGMGLHIILTGGLILDAAPQLKQFRAMGRVSWGFYYTIFVFLAVVFYQLLNSIKSIPLRTLALIAVVLAWSVDIYAYHSILKKNINTYQSEDLLNNSKQVLNILAEQSIKPERYQAMWVLPSSSEGTEKISFRDDWSSKMNAIPFSFQTGIPLTSIVMSRSSISNSLKVMQLSSSDYIEKEAVQDFISEKPLLVILQNDRVEQFGDIVSKSNLIKEKKDFSLFEIHVDSLKSFQKLDLNSEMDTDIDLIKPNVYLDFEEESNGGLLSLGSKYINGSEKLLDVEINSPDSSSYTLSLWYQITPAKSNVPNFNFQTFDNARSMRIDHHFRDWDMQRVEVIDDWIRIYQQFALTPKDRYIKLIANGEHIKLDRVLFKQDSVRFLKPTNESKYYQKGHFIVQKEF